MKANNWMIKSIDDGLGQFYASEKMLLELLDSAVKNLNTLNELTKELPD